MAQVSKMPTENVPATVLDTNHRCRTIGLLHPNVATQMEVPEDVVGMGGCAEPLQGVQPEASALPPPPPKGHASDAHGLWSAEVSAHTRRRSIEKSCSQERVADEGPAATRPGAPSPTSSCRQYCWALHCAVPRGHQLPSLDRRLPRR